jgi:hypothetical protein
MLMLAVQGSINVKADLCEAQYVLLFTCLDKTARRHAASGGKESGQVWTEKFKLSYIL